MSRQDFLYFYENLASKLLCVLLFPKAESEVKDISTEVFKLHRNTQEPLHEKVIGLYVIKTKSFEREFTVTLFSNLDSFGF